MENIPPPCGEDPVIRNYFHTQTHTHTHMHIFCTVLMQDGNAMLWDLNEKHLYTLNGGEVINALIFSPNRYWLCAATGQSIKIWVTGFHPEGIILGGGGEAPGNGCGFIYFPIQLSQIWEGGGSFPSPG